MTSSCNTQNEHVVRGALPGGSILDVQVCVVAELNGGKITMIREYFDTKAAEGLIRALSGDWTKASSNSRVY